MKTVIDYLRDSYIKYPNKPACRDEKESISYRQLWEDSERIAGWLECNYDMSVPVVLVAVKSVRLLIIIWSIIKAGGCYTVLDPMLPSERIRSVLNIISPGLIVSSGLYKKKINDDNAFLDIDELFRIGSDSKRGVVIYDNTPLYIMFTSGSTGIPKGVVVGHRSVVDFIDVFTDTFGIGDKDVIGNQAPWDFDVSVKDIYSSAKCGATLQIIPRKLFSFPVQLVDFLCIHNVTTLIWSVSALRIISSNDDTANSRMDLINKVIFSGEVMPPKHYNILRKIFPDALFANVYGPTEITCNCTYYIQKGFIEEDSVIPIGSAFENEKVFLLDTDDRLIDMKDTRITGEICVSGTAVAMGYYADRLATEKSFVQNPINDKYREIIYRTGDLAYYSEDGNLIYNGRKDNQIKHNGHRIELEEVERAINSVNGVSVSCCIYEDEEIKAFVESTEDEKIIHREIRRIIPDYMVPHKLFVIAKMPLNEHGKIDRHSLRNMPAFCSPEHVARDLQ